MGRRRKKKEKKKRKKVKEKEKREEKRKKKNPATNEFLLLGNITVKCSESQTVRSERTLGKCREELVRQAL